MINLSPSDRKRFHDLFQKIDTNSDGKIDVNDLVILFEKFKKKNNDNYDENTIDSNSKNSENLNEETSSSSSSSIIEDNTNSNLINNITSKQNSITRAKVYYINIFE